LNEYKYHEHEKTHLNSSFHIRVGGVGEKTIIRKEVVINKVSRKEVIIKKIAK
jgi:hypothetical protein